MSGIVDGFWLPQNIRAHLLSAETTYDSLCLHQGRPCSPEDRQGIIARWPLLNPSQWEQLLKLLHENRTKVPVGIGYWEGLQAALQSVARRLANPHEPLRKTALEAIPGYTGYSQAMIAFALESLSFFTLESMPVVIAQSITWQASRRWQQLEGLHGCLRFNPATINARVRTRLPFASRAALFDKPSPPQQVLGYAAGNVPGTSLLIAFLAMATTPVSKQAPVVIIKNSRSEPIFSSLILRALEEAYPELVASIAVLIWDYENKELQQKLIASADLVIAAASDETIAQVQAEVQEAAPRRKSKAPTVFHPHGHKVSFSAIGKEMLDLNLVEEQSQMPMVEIVTLLAALDSVFWDQYGCLSSRYHFIEVGGLPEDTALNYAEKLTRHMRTLATFLPRGAWPKRHLHDRFDRYKLLEVHGDVHVLSQYDDDFLVAIDHRLPTPHTFFASVNDCQGRVILIQPVDNLLEVPRRFLRLLPQQNLQSLSVAVGTPGEGLSPNFLRFATLCSHCGVTALRTLGRGAFPQLAYSWDGFIPLDLIASRPPGHFTTIEFDQPYTEIIQTFRLFRELGGKKIFPAELVSF